MRLLRRARRALGLAPRRTPAAEPPRIPEQWLTVLRHLRVDVVVDVGANRGQYGLELRRAGYAGGIVAVEPLSAARAKLERRALGDEGWRVVPYALGERAGTAVLNVAGNLGSSSLYEMLDAHRAAAPRSAYVGTETVEVRRLDAVADELLRAADRPWLKLDVQGAELDVLRGAGDALARFCAVQLELSTAPLYAGAPLRQEVERFLVEAGFVLAGVEQGFSSPQTGVMLQMDALFVRRDLAA